MTDLTDLVLYAGFFVAFFGPIIVLIAGPHVRTAAVLASAPGAVLVAFTMAASTTSWDSERVPGSEWTNGLTLLFFTPVVFIVGGIAWGLAMAGRALATRSSPSA